MSNNYDEVKHRNETFIEAIEKLNDVYKIVNSLPEYPEFNILFQSLKDMEENFRDRLVSTAKTTDKNLIIRLHQFDTLLGGGGGSN